MPTILHPIEPTDDPGSDDLISEQIAEVWYQYWSGSYEGGGHLILRTADGLWCHTDLGHCSCYEPLDSLNTSDGETTLDLLLERCSAELTKQLAPLVAAIRA